MKTFLWQQRPCSRRPAIPLLLMLMLALPVAHSHPHAWIDLHVTVMFDEHQAVKGLEQTWVFDPVYTMLLLEEMDEQLDGADRQTAMRQTGERMITSMRDYDYLTRFEHNDEHFVGESVDNVAVTLDDDAQLRFTFRLLLEQARDVQSSPLSYRIYDPLYYIEMLHPSAQTVIAAPDAGSCEVAINQPRPTPSQVARATLADAGVTDTEGLGRHFAQTVVIDCGDGSNDAESP